MKKIEEYPEYIEEIKLFDDVTGQEEAEFDEEEKPDSFEIEFQIQELLASDPEEFDEIEEYICKVEDYYLDDLKEFTFREAIRCGAANYVAAFSEYFNLNDRDGYSSYLLETEDKEMQELLVRCGAFISLDDYEEHRFAVESENGGILAFDSDFQMEVFEKYLSFTGLSYDKALQMLGEEYDPHEDDELSLYPVRNYSDELKALGAYAYNNLILFSDMVGQSGYGTQALIEELGWECSFVGDAWSLDMSGVFYID